MTNSDLMEVESTYGYMVINTLNAVTLPDFVQGCTQYISVETAPILQQQSRSWGKKRFDLGGKNVSILTVY